MYEKIYFTAFTVLIVISFPLFITRGTLRFLRDRIKDFIKSKADIAEAKEQADLIEAREKELWWLTAIVALLESAVFGSLAFLIFLEGPDLFLEKIKIFGAFLGGWLGIKVLSSHKPWSNQIVGKAYYHISLIGTLINITVSFFTGFLIFSIWFVWQ